MALSGSFTGSTSNDYVQPKITWSATQSVEGNYSDVTATLTYSRTNSGYTTSGNWSGSITIGGLKTSGSKQITITQNSNTVALTATQRMYHNADGSRTLTISASGSVGNGSVFSNTKCSASITLDTIPRAATLTSAPNFTDDDNPTIYYNNPAGGMAEYLEACISFNGAYDDIAYRDISKTSNYYTFNFTDEERAKLRAAVTGSNSRTVFFYVATTVGGTIYYSSLQKTLTIVNGEPVLTPTVKDTGGTSVPLTGDNTKVIKGFNYMNYSINAKAQKGARIVSQKIVCGGKSSTTATGGLDNVESGTFVFSATDNRGNTTTKTINLTLIDYVKNTTNLTVKAPTTTGDMEFTVSGNCYIGSFGATENDFKVYYRYKTNSEEYGEWQLVDLTDSISENKYEKTIVISDLDYRNSYTVEAYSIDKTYNAIYTDPITVKATPVFDWSAEDFAVNVPMAIQGQPVADFVIEEGTNGIWRYRIWNSGLAECWGIYTASGVNAAATNYNGFYYSSSISVDFPFTFAGTPVVQVNGGSSSHMNFVRTFGHNAERALFVVVGLANVTNTSITVDISAKGVVYGYNNDN